MSRYVSLAIDHGTTNSCIARMTAKGPQVLQAEPGSSILPSAVYFDSQGGLRVGSEARKAMLTAGDQGHGVTRYKLHIGTDRRYEFPAARKSMTAPELGSVVIQTLLRAHQRATGQDATACVITIPAKFKQNSVEGTRSAAELAGLKYAPLIMEPVAAAMCYGFSAKEQRAQWMVFDLGGGTLDVSLIIARKGQLVVPEGGHAGDDNLGGSKFDRELAGWVVEQLETRYKLSSFRNDQKRYSNEWGRLLLAVEEAKIKLSDAVEGVVELDEPLCRDDNGKDVEVKVQVTRKVYEDLVRPDIERSVQMCQMLLKSNRLVSRDVERLILVGGPSKTPLIRQMLGERLGIPLEFKIDPMTAVAEGAAIYADTIELPGGSPKPSAEGYSLKLGADRQSSIPVHSMVAMVDGPSLDGLRIEVERTDGKWKSKQTPVDATGVCPVELTLIEAQKPVLSKFRTALLDSSGREVVRVDEPQIWYPSLGVANRAANSFRVAIKGNRTELLIPPGAELPAQNNKRFVTTKALRKGSQEDVLRIPVLESVTNAGGKEDETAAGCLRVGTIRIEGNDSQITMDLPEGSEIEVHIRVDESRKIAASADIPMLDAVFTAVFSYEDHEYSLEDLESRLQQIGYDLDRIEKLQAQRPVKEVGELLDDLKESSMVEGAATDLDRATKGDKDSEVRVNKRIVEIEGTIRALHQLQNRVRIDLTLTTLRDVVKGADQSTFAEVERDFAQAKTDADTERCLGSVEALEFAVRGRPWHNLRLDLAALNNLSVTSHQNAVFNKAASLLSSIAVKGGVSHMTDTDIASLAQTHSELEDAYPDLYKLRQQKLDEWGPGNSGVDMTDVDTARR